MSILKDVLSFASGNTTRKKSSNSSSMDVYDYIERKAREEEEEKARRRYEEAKREREAEIQRQEDAKRQQEEQKRQQEEAQRQQEEQRRQEEAREELPRARQQESNSLSTYREEQAKRTEENLKSNKPNKYVDVVKDKEGNLYKVSDLSIEERRKYSNYELGQAKEVDNKLQDYKKIDISNNSSNNEQKINNQAKKNALGRAAFILGTTLAENNIDYKNDPDALTKKLVLNSVKNAEEITDPFSSEKIIKRPEAFDDGWQPGDVIKTIGGTIGDVGLGVTKGIVNTGESIGDLISAGAAQVADWTGNDEWADNVRNRIATGEGHVLSQKLGEAQQGIDNYSAIGNKGDKVNEALGYIASVWATGKAGSGVAGKLGATADKAAKIGKAAETATMFNSSAGGTFQESYSKGASDLQAWTKALSSATIETASERAFGVFGTSGADTAIANYLSSKMTSGAAKTFARLGVSATGEAVEEFLSYAGNYLIDNGIIDKLGDADYSSEWNWEELGEEMTVAFLASSVLGAGTNAQSIINNKTDTNTWTDAINETARQQDILGKIEDLEGQKEDIEKKLGRKLSNEEINNLFENLQQTEQRIQEKQQELAPRYSNEVVNQEEQLPTANEENSYSNRLKQEAIEEINNSNASDSEKQIMLNVLNNMDNVTDADMEAIRQTVEAYQQSKTTQETVTNQLETKGQYKNDQARRQKYMQYKNDTSEYNSTVVNEVLDTIPENRNGRRTVKQWLTAADEIGKRIANLSNEEIEQIAYKSWFDLQPTKSITQYDNVAKKSVGFQRFTSDEWINTINNAVNKARTNNQVQNEVKTPVNEENNVNNEKISQNIIENEQNKSNQIDVTGNDNLKNSDSLYFNTRDDGRVYVRATDKNGNIVYDATFIDEKSASKSLGNELAKYVYENTSSDYMNEVKLNSNTEQSETDYFMQHRPTESGITADNLLAEGNEFAAPKDIYEHPEYYSEQYGNSLNESMEVLKSVRNNPDAEVTIYRATTGDKINKGDWVTLSKSYAEQHNDSQFNGKGNIVEEKVKVKDIQWAGDDLNEWGYFPTETKVENNQENVEINSFKQSKNNVSRKTIENITDNLDIPLKEGAEYVKDTELSKKAGNNSNPKITNIDNIFSGITKNNIKEFRKKAIDRALSLFRNKSITIKDTNTVAEINKSGIKETYSKNLTELKIQSANDLSNIIEESIYKYTTRDIDSKDGVLYHHFFSPVSYNRENQIMRIVIKEFTKNSSMNDKFYYHSLELLDDVKNGSDSFLPRKSGSKTVESLPSNNSIPSSQKDVNYINNYAQTIENDTQNNKNTAPTSDNILATGEYTKRKTMNPTEISNLKLDNANTTPELKDRRYESGNKQSSFFSNIVTDAKFLNNDLRQEMSKEDNIRYYKGITNKETLEKAYTKLQKDGQTEVLNWHSKDSKNANAEDVTEGWILLKQYQDKGDYANAVRVAKKMRDIGTTAGQTIQAYNILSRLTPEGMFYYAQSELSEAYNKMVEGKSKKWIEENQSKFDLTPEETQKILDIMKDVSTMEDGYDKKVKLAEVQKIITDKIPPTAGQSIKAWMRISMLFNPKTLITRNPVGNLAIMPVNAGSDVFASALDKLIAKKTGVRTTGTTKLKKYAKGFGKGLYESYNDFRKGINTRNIEGNRFEISEGKSFKNKGIGKALNGVDNMLSFVLDAGDRGFYEATFVNSINNQLVLNNTKEVTQDMIDIATTEALQRTWQDNNAYTQSVLTIRNILNGKVGKYKGMSYGLGDVLIPFAKTPANLTKAIVDYSPAGLVKTLVTDARKFKNSLENGQYSPQLQHRFVQNLGKGMAGTVLYALGYALAKAGIATGESDEDKDVKNFMKNSLGISSYSIKIGNKSFTYDWAQPIAAPLSIMTNIVNSEDKGVALLEGIVGNLDTAGGILLEQSFMESLNEVANDADGPVSGIINQVLELPARAIPTFSKQIADLVDGTQRTTFEYNRPLKSAFNSIVAKIPGASKTLPASIDTLGNEIEKYGGNNNIFNVMFNPANTNKGKLSKAGEEIYKVYNGTGDKTIFPRTAPYYINSKGEKVVMDAHQRSNFQTISGKYVENSMNKLLNDSDYKKLDDEAKAEIINEIVSDSYSKAKYDVLKIDSEEYAKLRETLKNVNSGSYYNYKFKTKDMKKDSEKIDVLINANYTNKEKTTLYEKNILSSTDKKYPIIKQTFTENGLNITKYLEYKNQEFKADKKDDGTVEGKSISGSKKEKVWNYIENMDITYTQKLILYGLEYTPSDNEQRQIVNYIDSLPKTYQEKLEILDQFQGFTIYKNGTFKY